MKAPVPAFPLLGDPGDWDELTLIAATIFLEAAGEPPEGQLGVGWVLRRRALDWKLGWHGAILGPDGKAEGDQRPFEPFSCWNDTDIAHSRARLAGATSAVAVGAWRAAAAALWEFLPDPVAGASFYLRLDATRRIRGGTLPAWAADPADASRVDERKVAAVIGHHHFLRG